MTTVVKRINDYSSDVGDFESTIEQHCKKEGIDAKRFKKLLSASEEELDRQLKERTTEEKNTMYIKLNDTCNTFFEECIEIEDRKILTDLDTVALMQIDELIDSLDHVSEEQKQAWKQLLALDIPHGQRVKIIHVSGAGDLNMTGELKHIQDSMKARKVQCDIVSIDNTKRNKTQILDEMEKVMTDPNYDVIIPFFSTHGLTASIYMEGDGELGYTTKDSEQDIFFSENAVARNAMKGEFRNFAREADALVKKYMQSNSLTRNSEVNIPANTTFRVGNHTLTFQEGVTGKEQLETKISNYLNFEYRMRNSVTTEDLRKLQEKIYGTGSKELIYIFDCCFSGSATNDPLSKAKNTKAILAASATTQMALEVGGKGKFMYQLFEAYKSGASLGEAFVRSDILLNYGQGSRKYESTYDSGQWQNPAAAMKKEDGTVLRLTSVRLDQDVDQMA